MNNNYINSLANLAPWNMTTVIRTHYLMKPLVMDRKVNRIINIQKLKMCFMSLKMIKRSDSKKNLQESIMFIYL